MNNIFNTYNNNYYNEQVKQDINLHVPLTLEVINNIITNYYNTNFHVKQQGLTKFVKTLVNIHFNNITSSDLRPLLLLGFKQIHLILMSFNQQKLLNALIQHYNNSKPEVILSEIVTSLAYNNRDHYALKFRHQVQLMFGKHIGKHNNVNANIETFADELKPVYQINDKYYLLGIGDNKTVHKNIVNHHIPNDVNVSDISNSSKEQFNYIKNIASANALIGSVNRKLVDRYTPDVDYLLLVKKLALELKGNNNLLKARKIDFHNFTRFIYENRNNSAITNMTINDVLKKLFFTEDIKNVDVNTDLSSLDQDELYYYKLNLIRSLSAEEIVDLVDVNGLLVALIEKDNKEFEKILEQIDLSSLSHIDFKEYTTLEFNDKIKLINKLSNYQLNNIINQLWMNKDLINSSIDNNKLKAKIISRM